MQIFQNTFTEIEICVEQLFNASVDSTDNYCKKLR